ncbi:MAG: uracil-DNA glycosylase [Rhodobacteraceae bacterium]|nr:uracil-DNA glycosylase [Paracoccaceae bacterium]
MSDDLDWYAARDMLEWQVELGATEAIGDVPVDRYALSAQTPKPAPSAPARVVAPETDAVAEARKAAAAATSLPALRDALAAFPHCELKKGARNCVFSDGQAGARVMVIGEAPGRDEDREGRPFVGAAGQLLDKMLAAIGLNRAENVYITNVLPWRPPSNRDPKPPEIAMMRPFVMRHIALAEPEILIAMGNISCDALLERRGILKLRGTWAEAAELPVMPMTHPAYLLRTPEAKREAWSDLLEIRARLDA